MSKVINYNVSPTCKLDFISDW